MQKYHPLWEDKRSPEDKQKDYKHSELFGITPVIWRENNLIPNYPSRNQYISFSCLAQAIAKAFYILYGKVLSARPIYWHRINKPTEGMQPANGADLSLKIGACPEDVMPSQNMSDTQLDSNEGIDIKTYYKKSGGYIYTSSNIDEIAGILEKYKQVILCVQSNYDEYKGKMVEYNPNSKPVWGHAICAIGYTLVNGKKYIVIDNSWGDIYDNNDTQFLSEEFLRNRLYTAFYLLPEKETELPTYQFYRDLSLNMRHKDVRMLQEFLKAIGCIPSGISTTDFYGKVTKQSVEKFQKENKLPITGYFGKQSRAVANKLLKSPTLWEKVKLYFI